MQQLPFPKFSSATELSERQRSRMALCQKYKQKIIDGKVLSDKIRDNIRNKINETTEINQAKYHDKPKLGYILVGSKSESALYVRLKTKACDDIGIEHFGIVLDDDATEQQIIDHISKLSIDPKISGIMVQLPLPKHINEQKIISYIPPQKDVDGMNPYNIGTLAMKYHTPYFVSCTPLACQELILSCTSDIMSKKVCIIGRSNIVGMPLNLLLMKYHDASVTVCHSKTSLKEVESSVNQADILVACCGVPSFVQSHWIKQGSIVIDVGITYKVTDQNSQGCEIYGDVNFCEETLERVSKITPVPGGVGPMTITMLMNNLTQGWMRENFDFRIN